MIEQDILSGRRCTLLLEIENSITEGLPHTKAFAVRILGNLKYDSKFNEFDTQLAYGGYPQVAELGFMLASGFAHSKEAEGIFLTALERLQQRDAKGLSQLSADDIAILGLADGICSILKKSMNAKAETARNWLTNLLEERVTSKKIWTFQLRELAIDLLAKRQVIRTDLDTNMVFETTNSALEIVIRNCWPTVFTGGYRLPKERFNSILTGLLRDPLPDNGESEKLVIWLKALDLLIEQTCDGLFPKDTFEIEGMDLLGNIKSKLDKIAESRAKRSIRFGVGFVILVWLLLLISIPIFGWNTIDPIAFVVGGVFSLVGYLYYAITLHEANPGEFLRLLTEQKTRELYKFVDFKPEIYKKLQNIGARDLLSSMSDIMEFEKCPNKLE
jgi:hypothetical protein